MLAFNRVKVYPYGVLKCLDITGVCTECNAQVCIYSEFLPKEGTFMVPQGKIIIKIKTFQKNLNFN